MKQREIPELRYAEIVWIDSDDSKYKSRSREAYPYCTECKKNHPETEPMAYVYENAYGNLYVHCHRCGDTFSVVQYADAVIF